MAPRVYGAVLLVLTMADPPALEVVRFPQNPIIRSTLGGGIGTNINGPSLIRAPAWLPNRLGRYYLYFADHNGAYIRLAYADRLEGPWKVHAPGTLRIEQTACLEHIASPDVHVEEERREIRMYFHGPTAPGGMNQQTFLATSKNGIAFTASRSPLGISYFRILRWGGYYYALDRAGAFSRSRDGLGKFDSGPTLFPRIRHSALKLDGGTLWVFYSNVGDAPESLLLATIELKEDWKEWKPSDPMVVLKPELDYEGAKLPIAPSRIGAAPGPMHELRDPAIYEESGRTYLLYSVAGESGIAIAELLRRR